MSRKFGYITLLAVTTLLWNLSSCRQDVIFDGSDIPLEFSLDTLRFDTVFTEIGSVTRSFRIFNPLDEAVIIDAVELEEGDNSKFRLNVDGIPGSQVQDTRIEAQDSIHVFVEVTVDPDAPLSISPFVIEELIHIRANNSSFDIHLEAWGQNANYPTMFDNGTINPFSCNGGTLVWDDPKPYVIYGVLFLDGCVLRIAPGTDIFVHGGVGINEQLGIFNDGIIVISENSRIESLGTADEPVTFSSDRLEDEFAEVAGQWAGILIQAGSRGNRMEHTIVRHPIIGVSVDSAATLSLDNCVFGFTGSSGLVAEHADVTATNCLFFQNGTNGISLGYGGNYTLTHCTSANYDNQGVAIAANNIRCTDPLCLEEIRVNPLNLSLDNCILTGNDMDEISFFDIFDGTEPGAFEYSLSHTFLNVEETLEDETFADFFDHCEACVTVTRMDSLFISIDEHDYHLDTTSLAIDQGRFVGVTSDLDDNPREIEAVDVGCYEFQK